MKSDDERLRTATDVVDTTRLESTFSLSLLKRNEIGSLALTHKQQHAAARAFQRFLLNASLNHRHPPTRR